MTLYSYTSEWYNNILYTVLERKTVAYNLCESFHWISLQPHTECLVHISVWEAYEPALALHASFPPLGGAAPVPRNVSVVPSRAVSAPHALAVVAIQKQRNTHLLAWWHNFVFFLQNTTIVLKFVLGLVLGLDRWPWIMYGIVLYITVNIHINRNMPFACTKSSTLNAFIHTSSRSWVEGSC